MSQSAFACFLMGCAFLVLGFAMLYIDMKR